MCSDVDRNDKSRVCEPGSVRVIGRRQIEMYSRLIHTVDHIEGRLREGMDAFDAFLSPRLGGDRHRRAETLGDALHRAEREEPARLVWRGDRHGALQRRPEHRADAAHHPHQGRHRRGARRRDAALRFRSRGRRSRNRTEGLRHALRHPRRQDRQCRRHRARRPPASATASTSCSSTTRTPSSTRWPTISARPAPTVSTVRTPVPEEVFDRLKPDLVVLSPGPGTPKDFDCAATIKKARARDLPIFGVCLGLQALAEAYGGELRQLAVPMHGKPSRIRVSKPGIIFSGLPKEVTVGRYHSIFADPVRLPADFDRHRRDRGRRHHGVRAPQGADRGRAVPSRNRS